MKMVAEYLNLAHQFERLAEAETNPAVKKQFEEQAHAYHKLAAKRAKDLGSKDLGSKTLGSASDPSERTRYEPSAGTPE